MYNNKFRITSILFFSLFTLYGCNSNQGHTNTPESHQQADQTSTSKQLQTFKVQQITQFNEPWALAVLPDQRLIVTERKGQLKLFDPLTKRTVNITGLPEVAYGGQGGLGDIVLHPNFNQNQWVYYSYAEKGPGGQGAAVARAQLDLNSAVPALKNHEVIWRQIPKVSGKGHYGHRLAFDHEGKLWIASGERQKFTPAQDMKSNLGKVLRLNDDGTPASNNPFAQQGGVTAEIWSFGHRNPLGIAFDAKNQLWVVEMGPKGGDELNLIRKGKNYGYPIVSNGDHYDGKPIPDHSTRPEFQKPELSWTPVISPSSLLIYQGRQFPKWQGKALIGGLSSEALIIVDLEQNPVKEIQRIDMKERMRGLQEAQDGSIWVIEDGKNAKLLKLTAGS